VTLSNHLDRHDFHRRLAEQEGDALIAFIRPGDDPSHRLLAQLARLEPGSVDFAVFYVDASGNPELVAELGLATFPALLLHRDGELHPPLECTTDLESVLAAVEIARMAHDHPES